MGNYSVKNSKHNKRSLRSPLLGGILVSLSMMSFIAYPCQVNAQGGNRGFDPIQYMPEPNVPQNNANSDTNSSSQVQGPIDSPNQNNGGNFYSGQVSQEGVSAPLQATIKHTDLAGEADDQGGDLSAGKGQMDRMNKLLDGQANEMQAGLQGQDPDMADRELQVEWDKWRNRFLWSVQSGVQQTLNSPDDPNLRYDPNSGQMLMKFPMGTVAWFSCRVTKDRRILDAKITKPSGFPGYDRAVLNAVLMLDQSTILKFPSRSQRQQVYQDAGIKTAESGERQFFRFGDVERYNVPY